MTPLESALSAWIAFHAQLGVDMETYLLPPATEAQIVEVENSIGYTVDDEHRYQFSKKGWLLYGNCIL